MIRFTCATTPISGSRTSSRAFRRRQIRLFGGGDYAMRVWLDPDQIASRGMTAGDVVRAIREQNIQVSAGQLGRRTNQGGSDS